MTHKYCPLLRPAGFESLPRGLKWDYVEAPWDLAHRRTDIPRSAFRHGIIATERELTRQECIDFDLMEVIDHGAVP